MTDYKLAIVGEGRSPLETITEIRDVKGILGPIYTIGEFETLSKTSKQKRIPKILRSQTFEIILSIIVEANVRYVDITIEDWNIKFYTKNPEYNMYEYYLKISKNRQPINITR